VTPGLETEATYLVGYWLLLVAALLSLGAAVLALIPVRLPTWAQVNPDVSTPAYGIAPVVLPAQQPGVFQVDPLTGHPLPSPPAGVPVAYPQPYAPTPQPPGWQPTQPPTAFQSPAAEPSPNQHSALQSLAAQDPDVPATDAPPQPAEPVVAQPPAAARPPGQEQDPAAGQKP
jgi:hypothetical protein